MMQEERRVAVGDTILLHYQLTSSNGNIIESTLEEEPLEITLGQGELAWNLEQCLIGLLPNERHVFMLEPAQAFGCYDERLVQRLPLADFPVDMVPATQSMMEFELPNGTKLPGLIREIDGNEVVVDFNHPLSDIPVNFEVEVLRITPPGLHHPLGSH